MYKNSIISKINYSLKKSKSDIISNSIIKYQQNLNNSLNSIHHTMAKRITTPFSKRTVYQFSQYSNNNSQLQRSSITNNQFQVSLIESSMQERSPPPNPINASNSNLHSFEDMQSISSITAIKKVIFTSRQGSSNQVQNLLNNNSKEMMENIIKQKNSIQKERDVLILKSNTLQEQKKQLELLNKNLFAEYQVSNNEKKIMNSICIQLKKQNHELKQKYNKLEKRQNMQSQENKAKTNELQTKCRELQEKYQQFKKFVQLFSKLNMNHNDN